MNTIDAGGVARSYAEMALFMDIHACPACGCRTFSDDDYGRYEADDGRSRKAQWGRCHGCNARRRFTFDVPGFLNWEPTEQRPWDIGDQGPSAIIEPHEFVETAARLKHAIKADPSNLDYPTYKESYRSLRRALICFNEALRFIPHGADEIPAEAFRTPAAQASRVAARERYSRSSLETEYQRLLAIFAVYAADTEHFNALAAAHAAANPPPPPPPFSKESLEAHRQWAQAAEGTSAGRRLEATDTAQPGADLNAQSLEGSILTRVDLTGADLGFSTAHHVRWTDVKLTRARISNAHLYSSILTRCDFTGATLGITRLGDSRIEDCSFARAQMDRSSWYRSDVARCDFRGAVFGQSAFDHAVFVDCDFRGASLAMDPDGVMGTMKRPWFYRCDFRDVDWSGRWLYQCVFVDCLFAGARGTPREVSTILPFGCSLDPAGGPGNVTMADLLRVWQVPPNHVYYTPENVPRAEFRTLQRDILRDGKPVTQTYEDWSPLIQAELERDPTSPRPVPWR